MSKGFWRVSTVIGFAIIVFAIQFILLGQRITYINEDTMILILNILLLGVVPLVVSIIIIVVYFQKNIYSGLLISCGMLVFAVGAILREVLSLVQAFENTAVAVYTTCLFVSAILHITTALWERIAFPRPYIKHKAMKLAASIIGITVLILILFLGLQYNIIPFLHLREALLVLAMTLYFGTYLIFRKHYRYLKIKLLIWYSYWLLMNSLGIFLELMNIDGVLLWTGRISLYLGAAFAIVLTTEILMQVKQSASLYSKIMKYFANVRSGSRFIESSDNSIIMVDEKFNIIFYNAPSKRIFKYNEQETENQSILKLLLLEPYGELLVNDFENFIKTGASKLSGHTHEMEARDKEGRVFPVEISVFINKFEKRFSSTYIIKDITSLKEIEKETKRKNVILNAIKLIHDSSIRCNRVTELYHACINIVENVMDSQFCFIRQIGQDAYIHHTAFNNFGWSKFVWDGELCGHTWNGKEHLSKLFDSVLKDGKTFYTNTPIQHQHIEGAPDAHPQISAFLGVPITKGCNTVGMIGVARSKGSFNEESKEILEAISPTIMQVLLHKEVEEKLYDSEQRFHAFMDASPCVALMKDDLGRYVYFNKTWEVMYGSKAEDNIGKTNYDMLPKETADKIKLIDDEILSTGKVLDTNEELYRPGAKKRIWRMLKFPFVNLSGKKFTGCIALDITDRESMELELKEHAKELEMKNKLITDFFINISHEFKTPISILQLAVELANYNEEHGAINNIDQKKNLDIIKQNVYRLAKLVGNLLDITKIDAGFMQPNWGTVDVIDLLENLVDSIKLFASKRHLEISFISDLKSKSILTDSDFLERIVLNLVSNSIKYTQRGGKISIKLTNEKGNIIITVEDNGEGIPESKKDIIFDRFRQVNNSLARLSEGCGIGLSLTKALVELLGGSITFISEKGKGSVFFVKLPLKKSNCKSQNVVEQSESLETRIHMEFSDISFD